MHGPETVEDAADELRRVAPRPVDHPLAGRDDEHRRPAARQADQPAPCGHDEQHDRQGHRQDHPDQVERGSLILGDDQADEGDGAQRRDGDEHRDGERPSHQHGVGAPPAELAVGVDRRPGGAGR